MFDELLIGYELLHDAWPGLIEWLIPDTGGEILFDAYFLSVCDFWDFLLFLFKLLFSLFVGNFIYFVDENEDVCVFVELFNASESHLEILQNFLMLFSIFNFKHVDKNLYSSKNCLFLNQKVLLHECVLTSTIPEVESKSTHEFELMFLPLYCIADFLGVFGWEVSEDDRVHGGFSCSWVAHEKHFLHLWPKTKIYGSIISVLKFES